MNARDFLESLSMVEASIERTVGRIRRVELQLEVHGISYEGDVPTGDGCDQLSAGVVELLDYREYLKVIQRHYISQEKEADFVISAIKDARHQRVIALRYMDGLSFRAIGRRMDYSPEGARKLCEKAVAELDGFLIPVLQEYRKLTQVDADE